MNSPTPLITIHFDGGSLNQGRGGTGYGSWSVDSYSLGIHEKQLRIPFGHPCSCNQAEYLSLIHALEWLKAQPHNPARCELNIYTDSMLIKNQVSDIWRTKKPHLKSLRDSVLERLKHYSYWSVKVRTLMGHLVPPPPMWPGLFQKRDGTVMRQRDGEWQRLSPLFGEWLDCLTPTRKELSQMQPYPAAINVPEEFQQYDSPHA